MKRIPIIMFAWLALLPALALVSAAKPAAAFGERYYFSFEENLKPWSAAAEAGSKEVSLEQVRGDAGCGYIQGINHARINGYAAKPDVSGPQGIPQPVGTWIVASFPASHLNQITVSFNAVDAANCKECVPMVYIGAEPPRSITQFASLRASLGKGWQGYSYDSVLMVKDAAYVAIGWNGTQASMGLDCVSVNIASWD